MFIVVLFTHDSAVAAANLVWNLYICNFVSNKIGVVNSDVWSKTEVVTNIKVTSTIKCKAQFFFYPVLFKLTYFGG